MDQGGVRVHNDIFFSGHWKWRRGHGRVLNMGVNRSSTKALKPVSIQQLTKEKNHRTSETIQSNGISNDRHCFIETL